MIKNFYDKESKQPWCVRLAPDFTVNYSLHWPTVIKAVLAFIFFVTMYGIAERIG